MKMLSMRDFITLITLSTLFYGALEFKSYLEVNFVENDTPIKKEFNRALNGYPAAKTP
tara:strand:- start:19587 stop:19760 length:174 start_codon:yes stop_codon:yes gene_type:complete